MPLPANSTKTFSRPGAAGHRTLPLLFPVVRIFRSPPNLPRLRSLPDRGITTREINSSSVGHPWHPWVYPTMFCPIFPRPQQAEALRCHRKIPDDASRPHINYPGARKMRALHNHVLFPFVFFVCFVVPPSLLNPCASVSIRGLARKQNHPGARKTRALHDQHPSCPLVFIRGFISSSPPKSLSMCARPAHRAVHAWLTNP
jgi:hypothetical protein